MRKLAIATLAATLAIPSMTRAGDAQTPFGLGVMSCSEYVEAMDGKTEMKGIVLGWVQGFMVGLNMMHLAEGKPAMISTEPVEMATQMLALRGFCAKAPDATVGRAAILLYKSVREGQGLTEAKTTKKRT